jgi:hypothetical protein
VEVVVSFHVRGRLRTARLNISLDVAPAQMSHVHALW